MAWRRINKEHWQNDSDKHLFYDAEAKLLCTEAYPTEPGICMVVIPKDTLEEILKENRYYLVSEDEYLTAQRYIEGAFEISGGSQEEIAGLRDALYRRECKTNSLTHKVTQTQQLVSATLDVIDANDQIIASLKMRNHALTKRVELLEKEKSKIIEVGTKEIERLQAEIRALKEKYEA